MIEFTVLLVFVFKEMLFFSAFLTLFLLVTMLTITSKVMAVYTLKV